MHNDNEDERVELLVNILGRRGNTKWDHPIMGYKNFNEDQKEYHRESARAILHRLDEVSDQMRQRKSVEDMTIRQGDQVRFRSDCPGWWASVGKVLEGPKGEDVYYLIEGFGNVQRGKKYYRWELEKLPDQAVKQFDIGDIVYVENVTFRINGEDVPFEYIEGKVVEAFLSDSRRYLYTVRFQSVGSNAYMFNEDRIKGI